MVPIHRPPTVTAGSIAATLLAARVAAARFRRRRTARRPPRHIMDRLVRDPVFVLCSVRSGSTLLRAILNTHSRIHAPHELHFNDLQVSMQTSYGQRSLDSFGMTTIELENVLWDRLLYGELASSGKELIVDKTPQNAAQWQRIHAAWPHAKFIHLRRHPAAILQSRMAASPNTPVAKHLDLLNRYGQQLDGARAALPGPTVRYEDLTAEPTGVVRDLCAYLEVPWEPTMLDYDVPARRELKSGLGDWSDAIRSGGVRPARANPTEVHPEITDLVARWGYA